MLQNKAAFGVWTLQQCPDVSDCTFDMSIIIASTTSAVCIQRVVSLTKSKHFKLALLIIGENNRISLPKFE